MELHKYTDYFHDGTLLTITRHENVIEILMSSAEIDPTDLNEDIQLSKNDRIIGKLHIENVLNLKNSGCLTFDEISNIYNYGTILDFEIKNNTAEFGVLWMISPNIYSTIEIQAENIWWENIPDLDIDSIPNIYHSRNCKFISGEMILISPEAPPTFHPGEAGEIYSMITKDQDFILSEGSIEIPKWYIVQLKNGERIEISERWLEKYFTPRS